MQRLFSFLLILHLLSFVKADDTEITTVLCYTAKQLLQCANLGNVSYPACPELESLPPISINCSSLSYDKVISIGLPVVTGIIFPQGYWNFINLTWNPALMSSGCAPRLLANEANIYNIPEVIDLTSFVNGAFQLSSYNHILLFGCDSLSSNTSAVNINSTACLKYQKECVDDNISCAEIIVPTRELRLQATLEDFSCTHFQFFVSADESTPISSWQQGLVQLYGDVRCEACYISGGKCLFDKATNHTFQKCMCGNNTHDIYCPHGCSGGLLKCNTTARIAIAAASTVVGTVIAMMAVLWVYYRRKRYSTKSFTSASSNRLFTQRAYMLSKKFGPVSTKEFSFETLSKATKSFADENMIGDGGFGAVYLGILKDGRKVAVKRLYHDNFKRMDHFYNEIKILSSLSHPNLVKLYGFCCQDSSDLLLVFEYASNGTVSDQLHDAAKPTMPWKTRLNIARETAEALSYLHNLVTPPIYHRDVKTTNILLDDGLHAKLADFGLSRLVPLQATHVSTAPQGTPGYLDPDYHQCYQLTDKSDVYSFGVVLMELVSAKLAVDMSRDRREINLSNLALMKIGCGQWEDLVDPRLEIRKNPDVELMVKRVVELAFMCLHAEKDGRPTMKHIAETLTTLFKEFDYGHDVNGTFSFKVEMNAPSSADETRQLIKTKSTSKSNHSADSPPPSSSDWTSSNASSYVNSF